MELATHKALGFYKIDDSSSQKKLRPAFVSGAALATHPIFKDKMAQLESLLVQKFSCPPNFTQTFFFGRG